MKNFLLLLFGFILGVGFSFFFWKPYDLARQINYERRQKEFMTESIKDFQDNQSVIEQKLRSTETKLNFCIAGKG